MTDSFATASPASWPFFAVANENQREIKRW